MRALPVLLLLLACKPKGVNLDDLERPSNTTCVAWDRPATDASVAFVEPWPALDFELPVALEQLPDSDAYWYVVEQMGTIRRFDAADGGGMVTVLDVGDLLYDAGGNEWGLLGMDFHPNFAQNGYMFVNYTGLLDGAFTSFVVRYTSTDGGGSFDTDSAKVVLTQEQPYSNHNGGHVMFGPDGYLYIGLGDGGAADDPLEAGEDLETMLGKMLRIDVDGGDPYAIPADNPFADGVGGLPEIYAWGLRNPWRYSFDSVTGTLWLGDVGQDKWEEINIIESGGNYGWNSKEGAHCFDEDPCEDGPWIDPVVEYKHNAQGGVSVTGGYVYRGTAIPEMVGTYIYGDAYYGNFWALTFDPVTGEAAPTPIASDTGYYPVAFGQDNAGEVYFVDWAGGQLYRIDPESDAPVDTTGTMPQKLSATGCVDPANPANAADGLISYSVNSPLWSDGADKKRWFALPDGEQIQANDDGTWEFPVGSVIVKQFLHEGEPMETRLLVLHEDGAWTGYSYAWDADGKDATLLAGSSAATYGTLEWVYPSRAECAQCHTAAAGYTLGLRSEQLNVEHTYDAFEVTANQIDVLQAIGVVEGASKDTSWADPAGSGSAEDRARSYLASNCAHCHMPEGTGGGAMDLLYSTEFGDMGICETAGVNGDMGIANAVLFDPGSPETSLLALRMATLDAHRMPPLASSVVDTVGVAAVEAWVRETAACE